MCEVDEWNISGDGSTPVDSRSQWKWGNGGHHVSGFQALEEGEGQ